MAKTYETLLILDSNAYARDPGTVAKQIEQVFSDAGANVLVSRLWVEQKLAYPIEKHQKGTYWLVYSEIDGPNITKLNRSLQLFEPVLRQLTLKLDPRLVEPVLANARGEVPPGDAAPSGDDAADAGPEGVEDSTLVATAGA